MNAGAITESIDVAQAVLYLFWGFFLALVIYIQRESRREGYPLETEDRPGKMKKEDTSSLPDPKTYRLMHGGSKTVPNPNETSPQTLHMQPAGNFLGAPLQPTGNPMLSGVGPAAYSDRDDHPDLMIEGTIKIVPLRTDKSYNIAKRDPDPRGKSVYGADGRIAGKVVDAWVDRSERLFRYYEIDVNVEGGTRRVLLPSNFARVRSNGTIKVNSILAKHFSDVPATKHPEQITALEEDKIAAYYGGGTLYATPDRLGPWL